MCANKVIPDTATTVKINAVSKDANMQLGLMYAIFPLLHAFY